MRVRLPRTAAPLRLAFLLAVAPLALAAQSSAPPVVAPERAGLSAEVLDRIGPTMRAFVDEGRTGGIMTLVARRGHVVHWEAEGWRVLDEDPLERDDIFRIYSMTKPVTSVAVMMLVEEGRVSLDDPLSKFVPAFGDVRVYDDGRLRAPSRPIRVRDLLSHASGLTYGLFGDTPVDSMYRAARLGLSQWSGKTLEETVDALAELPLLADPGAQWTYSMSTDVLGRVVEVASGMTLGAFFRERIFEPLDMHDTGFWVPAAKRDRLTAVYGPSPDGLRVLDSPVDGGFTRPPDWHSGGGGLTSTAPDYLRFASMLLNGGAVDGVRLLRPETVALMTRNHLPDALMPIGFYPGNGFGLGFAIDVTDHPGTYWWLGVASTYFWIDPAEELIAFAWTQFQPLGRAALDRILRPIVYEAIESGGR